MIREIPAVSVAVQKEASLLLVRRAREPARGLYAFPGGRVEAGETLEAAARRELLEETGLSVEHLRLFETVTVGGPSPGTRFCLHVFLAAYAGGTPVAGDDAAETVWLDLAALRSWPLTASTLKAAETILTTPPGFNSG